MTVTITAFEDSPVRVSSGTRADFEASGSWSTATDLRARVRWRSGAGAGGAPAQVMVTTDSAGYGAVCVLHGRLADGQEVTATLTWHIATGDSCCNGFWASGGEFTPTDAGADGG